MKITNDAIELLLLHDNDTLSNFYVSYNKILSNYIMSYLKNKDDVTFILHDLFIEILNNLKEYDKTDNFDHWIIDFTKKFMQLYLRENYMKYVIRSSNPDAVLYSDKRNVVFLCPTLSKVEEMILVYKIRFKFDFKKITSIIELNLEQVKSIYQNATIKVKNYYKQSAVLKTKIKEKSK